MSIHEVRRVNTDDNLLLSFEGALSHLADFERELEPFLQALELGAGEWMPDIVKGERCQSYSRAAIWKILGKERGERSTSVGL
jgi:hypothetical protein